MLIRTPQSRRSQLWLDSAELAKVRQRIATFFDNSAFKCLDYQRSVIAAQQIAALPVRARREPVERPCIRKPDAAPRRCAAAVCANARSTLGEGPTPKCPLVCPSEDYDVSRNEIRRVCAVR
jgi:hypothetical protein